IINKGLSALYIGAMGIWLLLLTSCAYRLPTFTPPSEDLVRIITTMPEQFTLRVNTEHVHDYSVPHDGRVKVVIPAYRRACGVYLFDVVKVGGYGDPLKTWRVSIIRNGKTMCSLSLRAVRELATDDAGYRLISVKD